MERQRYALVTGASRGIGREIAIKLATELNYKVLVNYQSNRQAAADTQARISALGGHAELLPFDVSDAQAVESALSDWKSANPDSIIEVLVNNAGITRDGLLLWMSPADWSDVLGTSLHGFYHVTTAILQDLVRHRYGRIINVASVSGVKGTAGQVNYSAAKAGLIGATKALAQEVAKRNITVNAIAPGFIETDMTGDLDAEALKKLVPLNRFGTAEEVADLACFLASKKASYITGEVININGGIYS